MVGKVQVPVVEEAVKVQVTAFPVAGVAVRVTVAPLINEAKEISGVLSDVILSELEEPKSLEEANANVVGICVH